MEPLDKGCSYVEEATQATKYFRMETVGGREAFYCCWGPDTGSQQELGVRLRSRSSGSTVLVPSSGCWGRAGWRRLRYIPSEDSITPSLLHPHNRIIFPSQGCLPAWLMPFAGRFASPVPGRWQARRNTVTSSFLTHLHAPGIEGRLRAWSCFGRFLPRVGFLERHRAGICGGAG